MKHIALFLFIAFTAVACGSGGVSSNASGTNATPHQMEHQTSTGAPAGGIYTSRGKVTSVDAANKRVEIDHDEVNGLMPAMKMDFPVTSGDLLKDISVGDSVEFEFKADDKRQTIFRIEKLQKD